MDNTETVPLSHWPKTRPNLAQIQLCSAMGTLQTGINSQVKRCDLMQLRVVRVALVPQYQLLLIKVAEPDKMIWRFWRFFHQWQEEEFRELFLICGEEISQKIPQTEKKNAFKKTLLLFFLKEKVRL